VSRLLKLILLSCSLVVFAACSEGDDPAGNTNKTPPASTPVVSTAPKLSEPEQALILASAKGDTNAVKDLLDKGVAVDTRDPDGGTTPLGHAAWFGNAATAQLLIERGADVNAKKTDGATVLQLATLRKHNDIVAMLKKAGAK
jgi:ankyrin repeat protein